MMEAEYTKLESLFHSKKRTLSDLFTCMPHIWDFSIVAEQEEMACEEELSMLGSLLLHHRYEEALHSQRVSRIAHILSHWLCLSDEERAPVALGGLFHDIGKLGIPLSILNKQGPLNAEEWAVMRTHVRIGSEMLLCMGGMGKRLAPLIAAHHECWDGSGYPDGIRGNDIPRGARLLSVADAYDAMISTRPYRWGLDARDVKAELRRGAGKQFDPQMCDLVLHMLEKEPEVFSLHISRNTKEEKRARASS